MRGRASSRAAFRGLADHIKLKTNPEPGELAAGVLNNGCDFTGGDVNAIELHIHRPAGRFWVQTRKGAIDDEARVSVDLLS